MGLFNILLNLLLIADTPCRGFLDWDLLSANVLIVGKNSSYISLCFDLLSFNGQAFKYCPPSNPLSFQKLAVCPALHSGLWILVHRDKWWRQPVGAMRQALWIGIKINLNFHLYYLDGFYFCLFLCHKAYI